MQNVADIANINMFKKSAYFIDFFRNDSIWSPVWLEISSSDIRLHIQSCKELQNPSWSSNTCQRPVSVSQVVRSPGSVALTAHAYKLATWWLFALSGKTDLGVVACMIKVMFVWHQSGRKCGVGSQRTCSDFFSTLSAYFNNRQKIPYFDVSR